MKKKTEADGCKEDETDEISQIFIAHTIFDPLEQTDFVTMKTVPREWLVGEIVPGNDDRIWLHIGDNLGSVLSVVAVEQGSKYNSFRSQGRSVPRVE